MPIGDWIREAHERWRERWRRESYLQGYAKGYADADVGKPRNPPGCSESNQDETRDDKCGRLS